MQQVRIGGVGHHRVSEGSVEIVLQHQQDCPFLRDAIHRVLEAFGAGGAARPSHQYLGLLPRGGFHVVERTPRLPVGHFERRERLIAPRTHPGERKDPPPVVLSVHRRALPDEHQVGRAAHAAGLRARHLDGRRQHPHQQRNHTHDRRRLQQRESASLSHRVNSLSSPGCPPDPHMPGDQFRDFLAIHLTRRSKMAAPPRLPPPPPSCLRACVPSPKNEQPPGGGSGGRSKGLPGCARSSGPMGSASLRIPPSLVGRCSPAPVGLQDVSGLSPGPPSRTRPCVRPGGTHQSIF